MPRRVNLDEFAIRTARHWHDDGLLEMLLGLTMLVSGGMFLIVRQFPKNSAAAQICALAAPVVWICCSLIGRWSMKRLKETVAFPRTGYVKLPPRSAAQTVGLAALGAVAIIAAMVFGTSWPDTATQWSVVAGPGLAVVFSLALLFGSWRYGIPRLAPMALISLSLGAAAYWVKAGLNGGLWVLVGTGIALACGGSWRLRRFVAENPPVENHGL